MKHDIIWLAMELIRIVENHKYLTKSDKLCIIERAAEIIKNPTRLNTYSLLQLYSLLNEMKDKPY